MSLLPALALFALPLNPAAPEGSPATPAAAWTEPASPSPATAPAPTDSPAASPPTSAAAAPAESPHAAVAPAQEDAAWKAALERAEALLTEGKFAAALVELRGLAASAKTPEGTAVVRELAALAERWERGALTLVPKAAWSETELGAKAANQRSTAEITELYTAAIAYGVGTGVFLGVAGDVESGRSVALLSLLGGIVATGGVAIADSQDVFRYGVPQAIATGALLGLEEGLIWSGYSAARTERRRDEAYARHDYENGTGQGLSAKDHVTIIWASASAGAVAGGVVGALAPTTPGRGVYVGSVAMWSSVLGLLLSVASDPTDSEDVWLATGLTMNAGALLALTTAGAVAPSYARVRFMDLGAMAGGLGMGLLAAGTADDPRAALTMTALGVAGGYGVGWYLTRNMPKDYPHDSAPAVASLRFGVAPTAGGASLSASGAF